MNLGVLSTLKLYVPFGLTKGERWQVSRRLPKNQNDNGKGKAKGKEGKSKSANFTCLETQPNKGNEEQKVNMATRKVNLSGILGAGQWEKKDWPEECSAIVDT